MSDCWICKQKAEYRRQKLIAARLAAAKKANEDENTMAIWKEGCQYKFGDPASAGSHTIIEYISQHSQIATS